MIIDDTRYLLLPVILIWNTQLRAVTNVRTSLENTAMIFTKLEFQVFGDRTDPLPPSIPLPKVENPRY